MANDTQIQQVRNRLNVSQQEMATFLDVSRGILAKVESGKRGMSGKLSRKLVDLLKVFPWNTDATVSTPANEDEKTETEKAINKRIMDLAVSLHHARRALDGMTRQYSSDKNALVILRQLAVNPPVNLSEAQRKTLEWIQNQIRIKESALLRNSPARQALLELRIAAHEAEIDRARIVLNGETTTSASVEENGDGQ